MPPAQTRDLTHLAARLLTVCALALALAAPARAQMGRDQAAAAAERQTGGRVLAVDRIASGSGAMWRVKVVTPRGEVRVVLIEADEGSSMRSEGRDTGAQGTQPRLRQNPQRNDDGRRNRRSGRSD